MARRLKRLGLPPQHHAEALEAALRNAHESFGRAERELNTGSCTEAAEWLAEGFESVGMAEAHNYSSGGRGATLGAVSDGGRALLKEFQARCTRGIRAGGSKRHGLSGTSRRGGGTLPLYDEPGIDTEPEPEEDDITTEDRRRWFQSGKLYFVGDEAGLKRKMDADHFWPNVWFISDHGNAHLISVLE
jgi:hypothetical protein